MKDERGDESQSWQMATRTLYSDVCTRNGIEERQGEMRWHRYKVCCEDSVFESASHCSWCSRAVLCHLERLAHFPDLKSSSSCAADAGANGNRLLSILLPILQLMEQGRSGRHRERAMDGDVMPTFVCTCAQGCKPRREDERSGSRRVSIRYVLSMFLF